MATNAGVQRTNCNKEYKKIVKSSTDSDCGYINQERKKGLGYLTKMTTDTKNGIVLGVELGVDCYPANRRESDIILKHIEKIEKDTGLKINNHALDAGYDVGAVHRGLELMGVTGYINCIDFSNDVLLWLEYCDQCRESGDIPYKSTQFNKYYTKTQCFFHTKFLLFFITVLYLFIIYEVKSKN